jgi:hypothetical protein
MWMNPSSGKRRHYVRISVRALMVLVLFAGGWMGWLVRSARVQRAAVAAIQRVNGYVEYEWDFLNPNRKPSPRPWWPKWLVDSIGVDYFDTWAHCRTSRFLASRPPRSLLRGSLV